MGRSRKAPTYVIIDCDILSCIDDSYVLDLDSDPDSSFIDKISTEVADDILIALRKIFSLTFRISLKFSDQVKAVRNIRRTGVAALVELPEVLDKLLLARVPISSDEDGPVKVKIFKFCFACYDDLKINVIYKGRKRSLLRLIEIRPADCLIECLRKVVSQTFTEMHDDNQYEITLRAIRQLIWEVLPDYNDLLDDIEVEPIAPLVMQ